MNIRSSTGVRVRNVSKGAQDIIEGLLIKDPQQRLTCEDILAHPWLRTEVTNTII